MDAWTAAGKAIEKWGYQVDGSLNVSRNEKTILQYVLMEAIRKDRERQRRK